MKTKTKTDESGVYGKVNGVTVVEPPSRKDLHSNRVQDQTIPVSGVRLVMPSKQEHLHSNRV